jgi:hypothetical protein
LTVNIFAVREQRRISGEWTPHTVCTDLHEYGVGVDEYSPPARLELGDPIDPAQIQIHIAIKASVPELLA